MRWETISASSTNEVYQLWHNDRKLLTLTLHPFSNTARVDCEEEKRVFLIRKEGLRRNKTVLRNEYGIKIGELGHENKDRYIEVNNERFYYSIENAALTELIIHRGSKDSPVLVCGLDAQSGNTSLTLEKKKEQDSSHLSLLMAICWYMFLPVAKQKMSDFAI